MSVDFRRMLDVHDPEGQGVAPPVTTSKMVIPIVLASSSRHVIYTDSERGRHEAASWRRAARRCPTQRWMGPSPISPLSLACTLTSRAVGRRHGLSWMVGRFRPTVRRTTEPGHTLPLRPSRPAPAQPRGPWRASFRVVDGSPCARTPPGRRGPAPGAAGRARPQEARAPGGQRARPEAAGRPRPVHKSKRRTGARAGLRRGPQEARAPSGQRDGSNGGTFSLKGGTKTVRPSTEIDAEIARMQKAIED